jgi:hypothetical protein
MNISDTKEDTIKEIEQLLERVKKSECCLVRFVACSNEGNGMSKEQYTLEFLM